MSSIFRRMMGRAPAESTARLSLRDAARAPDALGFRSTLFTALADEPMNQGVPNAWRNRFRRYGVTADEMRVSGIDDIFAQAGENTPVTREQLLEAGRRVELREYRAPSGPPAIAKLERLNARRAELQSQIDAAYNSEQFSRVDRLDREIFRLDEQISRASDRVYSPREVERLYARANRARAQGRDQEAFDLAQEARRLANQLGAQTQETQFGTWTVPGGQNYREIALRVEDPIIGADFEGAHFGGSGVVAHMRTTDRTINGQRVLYLEEVQSDLFQQGRDRGFKGDGDPRPPRLRERAQSVHADLEARYSPEDIEKAIDFYYRGGNDLLPPGEWTRIEPIINDPMFADYRQLAGELEDFVDARPSRAPFVQSWPEMVLRRAIRIASEEGYDAIAIASPQAARVAQKHGAINKGIEEFYGTRLPRALARLGKEMGLAPESATLDYRLTFPEERGRFESGVRTHSSAPVTLMRLTPEARSSVVEKGFPMFSLLAMGGAGTLAALAQGSGEEAEASSIFRRGGRGASREANARVFVGPQGFMGGRGGDVAASARTGLSAAKILDLRGVDPEEIRQQTGWHRGPDRSWRFEIDDSQATIRLPEPTYEQLHAQPPPGGWETVEGAGDVYAEVPLGQLIDHPQLFANYPRLRELPVQLMPEYGVAYFLPSQGAIGVSVGPLADLDPRYALNQVLHEVQHMIQYLEDWNRGSSIEKAARDNPNSLDPYLDYMRSGGEWEARVTQSRQALSPEQRQAFDPYATIGATDPKIYPNDLWERGALAEPVDPSELDVRYGDPDIVRALRARYLGLGAAVAVVGAASAQADEEPVVTSDPNLIAQAAREGRRVELLPDGGARITATQTEQPPASAPGAGSRRSLYPTLLEHQSFASAPPPTEPWTMGGQFMAAFNQTQFTLATNAAQRDLAHGIDIWNERVLTEHGARLGNPTLLLQAAPAGFQDDGTPAAAVGFQRPVSLFEMLSEMGSGGDGLIGRLGRGVAEAAMVGMENRKRTAPTQADLVDQWLSEVQALGYEVTLDDVISAGQERSAAAEERFIQIASQPSDNWRDAGGRLLATVGGTAVAALFDPVQAPTFFIPGAGGKTMIGAVLRSATLNAIVSGGTEALIYPSYSRYRQMRGFETLPMAETVATATVGGALVGGALGVFDRRGPSPGEVAQLERLRPMVEAMAEAERLRRDGDGQGALAAEGLAAREAEKLGLLSPAGRRARRELEVANAFDQGSVPPGSSLEEHRARLAAELGRVKELMARGVTPQAEVGEPRSFEPAGPEATTQRDAGQRAAEIADPDSDLRVTTQEAVDRLEGQVAALRARLNEPTPEGGQPRSRTETAQIRKEIAQVEVELAEARRANDVLVREAEAMAQIPRERDIQVQEAARAQSIRQEREGVEELVRAAREYQTEAVSEPQRLGSFVRAMGGLKDEGGEVRGVLGAGEHPRRLLNNASGRSLDDAARIAFEQGYFSERPTIDEFIVALRDDLDNSRPSYRAQDASDVETYRQFEQLREDFDRRGVDISEQDELRLRAAIEHGFLPPPPVFSFNTRAEAAAAFRAVFGFDPDPKWTKKRIQEELNRRFADAPSELSPEELRGTDEIAEAFSEATRANYLVDRFRDCF